MCANVGYSTVRSGKSRSVVGYGMESYDTASLVKVDQDMVGAR